ncbi:exopolysaccharide biosynthesis protein [Prosthecomicrobium hirschii]|uniref:exopolysaccharide biosynthesis protein n=1 Tax=Prosthecodimorpha hirschii TaxID=665126 RepID=UPI00221F6167|nr:exopolysaccharide biosynthesis protein [Prosthecomicrobium hirschii]MCW1841027.1 exopolysaccharide biosynthesis protein [Prosthecomicrobium hirschii]
MTDHNGAHPSQPDLSALPASRRLNALAESLDAETVGLGELVDRLGHAGFGFFLLILTIIVLIPIPGPVGMVLGIVIGFVALQLLIGARRLWLPGFMRRRRIPAAPLKSMLVRIIPKLAWAEAFLKPRRWPRLTGFGARSLLAVPVLLMGATISLPIPLGNFMPALALMAVALGLIVRDGLAVIAGLVLAVLAIFWTSALFVLGAELTASLIALLP